MLVELGRDALCSISCISPSTFLVVGGRIIVMNDKYDNTQVCYLTILTKEFAFSDR